MKIYNNCTDDNKLFMYSKYLIDTRGSAFQYGINWKWWNDDNGIINK